VTDLEFACPRCQSPTLARYYGPCEACRSDLVAKLGGNAREVELDTYEPKMNVTPNAVASARND
jgi:hypothetical protein